MLSPSGSALSSRQKPDRPAGSIQSGNANNRCRDASFRASEICDSMRLSVTLRWQPQIDTKVSWRSAHRPAHSIVSECRQDGAQ